MTHTVESGLPGYCGKVTYKKTKGNKNITISKTGTITIKKGLKKGSQIFH